jgi:hypothetical protein
MEQSFPVQLTGPPAQSSLAQAMLHEPASHWTPELHVEPAPVQSTLHVDPVHLTPAAHDPSPVQAISQEVACVQSTPSLQVSFTPHWTAHGIPTGHVTPPGAHGAAASLHSITHVPASQAPASQRIAQRSARVASSTLVSEPASMGAPSGRRKGPSGPASGLGGVSSKYSPTALIPHAVTATTEVTRKTRRGELRDPRNEDAEGFTMGRVTLDGRTAWS